MATFIILSGKHQGKRLSLPDKEVTIGRDPECGIRVASTEVSRQHCVLLTTPEGLKVRDLDSQNGTFVNETAVEGEQLLRPGDVLTIGPMQFQLAEKKPKPAAHSKSGDPPLSDDDIASWLGVGDESSDNIKASDTTIIPNSTKTATTPPPPPKKQFRSIGDEAADIIRRHWESVNHNKTAGPT